MSSSVQPDFWAHHGHNIQLKLTAGPGVKGLYIDGNSAVNGEREMMFQPDTRMVIHKVETKYAHDKSDGFGTGQETHVVHAMLLPHG